MQPNSAANPETFTRLNPDVGGAASVQRGNASTLKFQLPYVTEAL